LHLYLFKIVIIINYQLSIINYQLSIINYFLFKFQPFNC
jgi:hypothetical protein